MGPGKPPPPGVGPGDGPGGVGGLGEGDGGVGGLGEGAGAAEHLQRFAGQLTGTWLQLAWHHASVTDLEIAWHVFSAFVRCTSAARRRKADVLVNMVAIWVGSSEILLSAH